MLYTKRVQGPSPVCSWVVVNEVFDESATPEDLELWGGLSANAHDIDQARAKMVKDLLSIAHGTDRQGRLLVNDFSAEFYPPPLPGRNARNRKLAGAIHAMRSIYVKAISFYQLMANVVRDAGAIVGRLGVGYQTHFIMGPEYLANPPLWRAALLRGIRKLRGLGLPVQITEMVVKVNGIPDDPTTFAARNYGADHTNPCWIDHARVYRDMLTTYFSEPGCDTAVFWGLVDVPNDEFTDWYGHLFDATPTGTQGEYPTGTGLLRKPAYFGVLNALIEGGHARHGPKRVPNWLRRWAPR